ncbi:MAG: hypothetical protein KJS87_01935 [Alphaproteobacteria bacterium]|nr:hypothetical protein [Alphaproteobacteria bacterium]
MRVMLVACAIVLSWVGVANARSPVLFSGSWTGTMTQSGEPKGETYPMRLTFKGEGGETSYPAQGCSGVLTPIGTTGDGYAIYAERITKGRVDDGSGINCIDGIVVLKPHQAYVTVGWYALDQGQPVFASASLAQAKD